MMSKCVKRCVSVIDARHCRYWEQVKPLRKNAAAGTAVVVIRLCLLLAPNYRRVAVAREMVPSSPAISTAVAELKPGERVLDLGSGGGIDVLLSARRVGPTGFVYGLDMTDSMLELAERNRIEAGIENVRFLKGVIEDIPLSDNAVDVVISNCVINLSADKGQVLREAYRVLSPGGHFAVSDVVFLGHFPQVICSDLEA